MTPGSAARAAWAAGLNVLPPKEDGSKRPDATTWEEFEQRRTTEDELDAWYGPHTGVGAVCGAISGGLQMFEFEGRAVEAGLTREFREAAMAAGLGPLLDTIMTGYLERTPSGGFHLLYRCPTPVTTKLASRPGANGKTEVMVETKGEGGYTILAPSNGRVHPSGGAWTLEAGGFETIASISDEESEALFALARTFDRMPAAAPRQEWTGSPDEERASDRWEQRADITEVVCGILGRHGWTHVHTRADGVHLERRPSKDRGWSATLGHKAPGVLHVFTTSAAPFDGERAYRPFTVYGLLEHGGDWSAAGKALYEAEGPHGPTLTSSSTEQDGSEPALEVRPWPALPPEFWTERPWLRHVKQAAWSRQRTPDAVLAAVLARLSASLPHGLGIPPIVGAEAGLSLLVAVVAPPGSGKSNASTIAEELLPSANVLRIPTGSGEGLVEAMFEMGDVEVDGKAQRRKVLANRNILVTVDEGQKVSALAARSGSTLFATWRSVFTGGQLGEANASAERNRIVPAGAYSTSIVVIFQPELLGPLFDDLEAGTPQRFLYFPGTDPTLPDTPPSWPGCLEVETPDLSWARPAYGGVRPHHLKVADTVAEEVRLADLARQRGLGTTDPWAAHRNLARLKVAALFAIMDRGVVVGEDDWRIAGSVVDTSDAVRKAAQAVIGRRAARDEADGARRAGRKALAVETMSDDHRLHEAAVRISEVVRKWPGELSKANVRVRLTAKQRDYFEAALDYAIANSWVREETAAGQGQDKVRYVPGEERP